MKKIIMIIIAVFTCQCVVSADDAVGEEWFDSPFFQNVGPGGILQYLYGECGDNVTWELSDDGTFTLRGGGEMYDYECNTTATSEGYSRTANTPWYSERHSIKNVVIENGITNIGACSFLACKNITSINVPNSVISIETDAFWDCIKLRDIYYGGSKTQWETISIGSGNTPLDNAEIICLVEDKIQDKDLCFICNSEILNEDSFYDEGGNQICESCYNELIKEKEQENKKILCAYCDNAVNNDNVFYDDDNNLLCQECYEEFQATKYKTEKILCFYCEKEIANDEYCDEEGNVICQSCYDELPVEEIENECLHCGEIFKDSETVYDSDGYASCPFCYEYIDSAEEPIDFDTSDWAADEVYEAYQNFLIPSEMEEDNLKDDITRAEFAGIAIELYYNLINADSWGVSSFDIINTPFTDVSIHDPYSIYVTRAYQLGITDGVTDTTFCPDDTITREQMATMLYRAYNACFGYLGYDSSYNIFYDDWNISDWAYDAVYALTYCNAIEGMDNNCFMPKLTATKEQAILIALRILNNAL